MAFLYSLLLKPKSQKLSLIPPFFSPISKSCRFYFSSIQLSPSPLPSSSSKESSLLAWIGAAAFQLVFVVPFLPPSNPSSMKQSRFEPHLVVLYPLAWAHSAPHILPLPFFLLSLSLCSLPCPPGSASLTPFLQTQLTPYHPIYFLYST